MMRTLVFSLLVLMSLNLQAESIDYYLPKIGYDQSIDKPESVLGFTVGERHIRHDQLVQYFQQLAQQSNRIKITQTGRTNQFRQQFLATFSSPENIQNLDAILSERENHNNENQPLVIWLGYSVHGDEISGANASLLMAYYLAAAQSQEVAQLLNDIVIVMEPSINPDGMDRFENWVNTFRSKTENTDPNHIEHHQGWPTGRTNHYWFDLNRDWLFLTQKESQHRLKQFHAYQPNVLADFHEMGPNSTYFFQPGIPSRTNPLTPKENVELTNKIATYHANILDADNRLYYTKESFDDFYYGKGSTLPDIHGGVGILFEQASSRGYKQETINGTLSLAYGIKNHVLTSLSTIQGSYENREQLADFRKRFYNDSIKTAGKRNFEGYVFQELTDKSRLDRFLSVLKQHKINVYPLTSDYTLDSTTFKKNQSYFVPLAQKQYHVIEAIFKRQTSFKDPTFYDVSGWTLPLAMDIEHKQVKRKRGLKLAKQAWQGKGQQVNNTLDHNAQAYVFSWHDMKAPSLLNSLLTNNIKARVTTKPFTASNNSTDKQFAAGSIVVSAALQTQNNWQQLVEKAANDAGVEVFNITTGLTVNGPDLGSRSMYPVNKVKALMVGGKPVSQYEAGSMSYYFDEILSVPLTIVDMANLSRLDLSQYTHVIMVDGRYNGLSESVETKLSHWVKAGGVLYTQKRASQWAAKKGLLKASFVSKTSIDNLFETESLHYKDMESHSAKKRVAGAIFSGTIDNSHPLGYGYVRDELPVFKNSTTIIEAPSKPFIEVVKYNDSPLLSGYADPSVEGKIANNASVIAHNVGRGRIVASADNLVFRGHWLGTAKIVANTLFFGKTFSASAK